MLLEEWLNMESSFGEIGDVSLVRVKLPKKLKKRRHIETDDGAAGYDINPISHSCVLYLLEYHKFHCSSYCCRSKEFCHTFC